MNNKPKVHVKLLSIRGDSEKLFFDKVCRVMEYLEIDLTKLKVFALTKYEDYKDENDR